MAITRIQPLSSHLQTCANPAEPIPEKQVYTVWMKSLVFNGRGCTIYGQDGRVAYRVDNYACRRRRDVYVMDSDGKTLIKLLKKNFGVFKTWKGYSCCSGPAGLEQEDSKPWFSVQKSRQILKDGRYSSCATVTICISGKEYKIDGVSHKSEYRISNPDGEIVAEMKRKQTASGVVLGEDVLSLTESQSGSSACCWACGRVRSPQPLHLKYFYVLCSVYRYTEERQNRFILCHKI